MFRATVIAPIVCVMVAASAHAQQACTKIAYVNTQALMEVAPGRVAAESLLNKTGDGFRMQLQKLQDSAQARLASYQKDQAKMTPAAKDKAEKELQALETDIQTKQQQFQQQFDAKRQEVMAPITDVVKKVLDDVRAEDCYAMILDNAPGAGSIVSADKNLDITDRVVSRLRATPAAKTKAADTTPKGAPAAPAGVTSKPPKPPAR